MSGRRQNAAQQQPYSFPASASAYTFTVPRTGKWKFVAWGPGGNGGLGSSGASGAYVEVTRQLQRNATVTITVGRVAVSDTTIVFPNGYTVTAGRATTSTAGTATNGDVNLNGSAGGLTGAVNGTAGSGTGGGAGGATNGGLAGGSGAPANLPYRGGEGVAGGVNGVVGIGSGGPETAGTAERGGCGFALAVCLKAS